MRRAFALILSLILIIAALASCDLDHTNETESAIESESLQDKTNEIYGSYCRLHDYYPDSFSITLYPDGTYQYYETLISSHIGHGKYTVDGNVITLIDDGIPTLEGSKTHYFKFEYRDGKLIYLAEGSNNFMYIHLPDDAEFCRVETENTTEE
jgi:hypothetical protein